MERKLTFVLLFLLTVSVVMLFGQAGVQRFERLHVGASFQDPGAGALSLDAGITANSVGIVGSDGRIPALTTTFLANLSGATLTALAEANITNGTLLARVGSPETITDTWTYTTAPRFTEVAPVTPVISTAYFDTILKAWARIDNDGVTATIVDDYNISAVTRSGPGNVNVEFATTMATLNYAVMITIARQSVANRQSFMFSQSVTQFNVQIHDGTTGQDEDFMVVVFGR